MISILAFAQFPVCWKDSKARRDSGLSTAYAHLHNACFWSLVRNSVVLTVYLLSFGSDFSGMEVTDFCISLAYFATHRETVESKDRMPYDKPVKAGCSIWCDQLRSGHQKSGGKCSGANQHGQDEIGGQNEEVI